MVAAHSLQDDLDLLRGLARQAGSVAMRHFGRSPDVSWKGDSSPVTEADLAIDGFFHDAFRQARPDYGWLSEERPDDGSRRTADRTLILDPIDGTRAFIAETDQWCVSAGLVEDGQPVAGVLYAPASGTEYSAIVGQGAWCNGVRLALGGRPSRERPVYAGPGVALRRLASHVPPFAIHDYVPSLALRLAYVADARIDATLIRPNAAWWDMVAADLIVREAGGVVLDFDGSPPVYSGSSVTFGAMMAANAVDGALLKAVVAGGHLV